jgi:hypothetical protein
MLTLAASNDFRMISSRRVEPDVLSVTLAYAFFDACPSIGVHPPCLRRNQNGDGRCPKNLQGAIFTMAMAQRAFGPLKEKDVHAPLTRSATTMRQPKRKLRPLQREVAISRRQASEPLVEIGRSHNVRHSTISRL